MKREFNLQIMTTSDTHGYVYPLYYGNNSRTGNGLTRVARIIKKHRKRNSLLIDLGDSIQGSPLLYFHQLNRKKYPNPVARVFNHLNYDLFIPGNHDFNYGRNYLFDFIEQLDAETICGNILTDSGKPVFGKKYKIIEFEEGPKICIIGLTTQYIPNWENPQNIKGYIFENVVESAKKIIAEVKRGFVCDLFIVAYHGGFERDIYTGAEFIKDTGENLGYRLLSEIPEIGVLLTGHQHREIALEHQGVAIIQPGGNAADLGVVEVDFELHEGNWQVVSKRAELLAAKDYESDIETEDLCMEVESANQKFLDQPIGIVAADNLKVDDLFQARLHKHPIVSFINRIQLDASGADISSTSLANNVTGFEKEITIRNVLSTYIYPNTLVVVEITGSRLKAYLERNAEYFVIDNDEIIVNPRFSYPKMQHYNYDMFDGIDYKISVSKPMGERVEEVKFKGKAIKDDDRFSLVLNSYRASGGGDFEMLEGLKVIKEIPFDIAELMIDYIRKNKRIKLAEVNNIQVTK